MTDTSIGADESALRTIDSRLMARVFYSFAALVAVSIGIMLLGKAFGPSILMAGYTDDQSLREIVIGNDVIATPANTIRFDRARRDGIASRLDLYWHWPDLNGYSEAQRDDFNNAGGAKRILFLSFEPRSMSRDMSGRFEPIYESLIAKPGAPGPAATTIYNFSVKSGYVDEVLAVATRPGGSPFVARCLTGPSAQESLAPCERDVQVGGDLSLTYRFPREMLAEWKAMDAAVMAKTARILKTGK